MAKPQMNRPYGAVDVSANLKGAVAKSAVQKMLVALAEKGELVQKTYGAFVPVLDDEFSPHICAHACHALCLLPGKTTFFVANQAKIEEMPLEKQAALESEFKSIDEENKQRAAQVKALTAGKPGPPTRPLLSA